MNWVPNTAQRDLGINRVPNAVKRSLSANYRSGFTLIEMMIVFMLSSIVIGIMLSSYSQLQRTTRIFDSRVELESNVLAIASLFERDVSGAFIPLSVYQVEKEKKAEVERAKREKQPAAPTIQKPNGPQLLQTGQQTGRKNEKEHKTPELKALFFAQRGDEDITELFTCITDNPLDSYWSEGAGYAKPKIARVVYRLKENTSASKAPYSLWRQEEIDLDFAQSEKTASSNRSYLVSDMVSHFSLTFYSYETDEEGKTQEDVSEFEYGTDQEAAPELPQLVKIDLTLYDPKEKRSQDFSATYRVWAQPLKQVEAKAEKEAPIPTPQPSAPTPTPQPRPPVRN